MGDDLVDVGAGLRNTRLRDSDSLPIAWTSRSTLRVEIPSIQVVQIREGKALPTRRGGCSSHKKNEPSHNVGIASSSCPARDHHTVPEATWTKRTGDRASRDPSHSS